MIEINGNPRLPGSVTFSPEALTTLQTYPPTPDSIRTALKCGRILGSAFGDYSREEGGEPSFMKTALKLTAENNMPFETTMSFLAGITSGMESKLKVVQFALALQRISSIAPARREALLTEIARRQKATVIGLTAELRGLSNE